MQLGGRPLLSAPPTPPRVDTLCVPMFPLQMTLLKRNLILHLIVSIFLYVLFASLDIYFTLGGIDGDVSLEGNPMMRYMMVSFGLMGGLVIERMGSTNGVKA